MNAKLPRRRFLGSVPAIGFVGLGGAGLVGISPATAAEMELNPTDVQFRPEIEPVVRWIEETPRDSILEGAATKIKDGWSYQTMMAGVFLAGIRDIKPRPVGYKFHAVMAINSAHILAQAAALEDRLLPLFWALDNFKSSQAQDVKEGDWTLAAVDEAHVPNPSQAKAAFVEAMDAWDSEKADAAVAAFCRSHGAAEVMEAFWRYGVRDQRNIGHKAIFTAQCWRTLQVIGWQHAEPVLRSLAFGVLDLQNDARKGPVGPFEQNLENARRIREGWAVGKHDAEVSRSLLEALRTASPEEASSEVVKHLNAGVATGTLWDGIILAGAELLMRGPGIASLHATTSLNALHYTFNASGDDTTRKLALLQAAGWVPMFRGRVNSNSSLKIDAIEPITDAADPRKQSNSDEAIADIFSTVGKDRVQAGAKAIGFVEKGGSADAIYAESRRLIFRKGRDSHDYKYGAAAWEEYVLASDPKWQAPLTAAALSYFPAETASDSSLMKRAREAVAGLA